MNVKLKKNTKNFATLVEMLQQRSKTHPEKLIYSFLNYLDNNEIIENDITYHELDKRARNIAAWFQDRNAFGERALLLYPPGLDYISAYFGCLYAGVSAIPAYPRCRLNLSPVSNPLCRTQRQSTS